MFTIISTLIWLEAAPENMKFLVNPLLARWLRKVMNEWEKMACCRIQTINMGPLNRHPNMLLEKREESTMELKKTTLFMLQ